MLTSGNDVVLRRHELEALARCYRGRSLAQWVATVCEGDDGSGAVEIALGALPRYSAEDVVEQVNVLVGALDAPSGQIRVNACRALAIVGAKARTHHRVQAALPPLRNMRAHDSWAREAAAAAVATIEGR